MSSNQRNFNGSTVSLGGTSQGKITKISATAGGAKIDVFQPGDLAKLYELGDPDFELGISMRGTAWPTNGATGALVIALGNGAALPLGPSGLNWQCGKVTGSGAEDGAWEGTASYWPTTPAST